VGQPEAGEFSRVHPITPLLRGGLLVAALGAGTVRQMVEGGEVEWSWWVLPLVALAGLAAGAASWWFTRFRIGSDELRIDSGVLVRRSRRIRLDRIQAVEVQQPFLARIVGMAALGIETAGGSGTEATLAYLSLSRAGELRRHLLVEAGREGAGVLDDAAAPSARELVHQVPPGRLLAAQLLRTGPLVAGLAALAFAMTGTLTGTPLSFAVFVPVAIAVVSRVLSGFTSGYGFVLHRSAEGLAARAGLLGVSSSSLPVHRVRGLVVREPAAWRLLGWVAVDVTVAGVAVGDDEENRLSTTLVPVATRGDLPLLLERALPGLNLAAVTLHRPPAAARWLDPIGFRMLGVGADDGFVITRRGLLTRRTDVAPRIAVQSAAVFQGPLERWLGLATTLLHLPSGPASPVAVHRDAGEAWQLVLSTGTPPPPA
jgi:putative membrane protein